MSYVLLQIGVILVGGCLAFMMVMSEFFLISRTSVVTLSVCGIFKVPKTRTHPSLLLLVSSISSPKGKIRRTIYKLNLFSTQSFFSSQEVLTIFISSIIFGDILTPINIAGLCVTLLGIGAYNYLKIWQLQVSGDRQGAAEVRLAVDDDQPARPRPSIHLYNMVAESTPMLLMDGRMMGGYEDDEEDEEDDNGREVLEMT
ncbi:hypothetical protein BC936DRAFT_144678 [Jimgerdemannia flammicorona]|uniref:GDP-mannose transporter n=1 Tax=Jimgerdemannia flammicorona TaxID=994334 RepID=A0A433DBX6_9FUNG|nr:hypothetical protein BC936DRAFT_144678 [Jimgerdemannia flammicorona]